MTRSPFAARTLAVAVAAALLALAGCGAASRVTQTPTSTKTLKVVYEFQQTPGAVNTWGEWLHQVLPVFKKQHPGVHVQLIPVNAAESAYYTKLDLMESSSSTAPDVVVEDTYLISSDEEAGYLAPLTKRVGAWSGWKQFYPSMQALTRYNGQVWGVPVQTDARFLWYNKALLRKAGITVPWHPKNWAELLDAAKQIRRKDPGVIPFDLYAGTPEGEAASMQGFEMLLYGTGDSLYDYKTNKWVTRSPGLTKAFTFYRHIFGQRLGPSPGEELVSTWGTTVADELLPKQKLAIDLDGSWLPVSWVAGIWPSWRKYMAWTAMPTERGQPPGQDTLSGGWALSISRRAHQPALAWDFIRDAASKQSVAANNKIGATLAPRRDSATVPSYIDSAASLRFSLSLLAHTYFRPAFPAYAKLTYLIQQETEAVMTGSVTPAKAATQYANGVESLVGSRNVESVRGTMTTSQLRPPGLRRATPSGQ